MAQEFSWTPRQVDALYLSEARMLAEMAESRAKEYVFIPVEKPQADGLVGEITHLAGRSFVKVPRQVYEEYTRARQAAEIVWAVLHASPKFKGAKRDDIIPKAPWHRILDKAIFAAGLEHARANGLAPPSEVKEVERQNPG